MRAGMKWAVAALGVAGAVLGCNAILGVQDVRPEDVADAAAVDETGAPDAARDATPPRDTGSEVFVPDSASDCPDSGLRCNATCTDTTKDARNCGACNHDCTALLHVTGAGATCSASKCSVPASACAQGYAHCTVNPDDGCETDITKATQCGSCGAACPASTPSCQSNGTGGYGCVSSCSGTTPTLCGTTCVNTTKDPNHCNSCTNACPQPPGGGSATCVSGTCGVQCNPSFHQCGTTAVCALDTDATKCGPTCTSCPVPAADGSATCTSGQCGISCNLGFMLCNGACVSTTDLSNCGTCGQKCNGGETCAGAAGCQCNGAAGCYRGLYCSATGCSSWASWPMPNPVAEPSVPNHASYDTSSVDVVVDRVTGLTWERVMDGVTRTLSDSKLYCAGLTLAGKNDWRVPTRIELVSLLDFTRATPPTIDPVAFPNTVSGYWSSSPMAGDPTLAWGVNFGGGYTYRLYVTTTNHVRCVR